MPSVLFSADDGVQGRELWRSDGTAGGTTLVADLNPGSGASNPANFFSVDGVEYFTTTTPTNPASTALWRTDGTAGGTIELSDPANAANVAMVTPVGDKIFWLGFNLTTGVPEHLMVSDGSLSGTVTLSQPSGFGGSAVVLGDQLIFETTDGSHGEELWTSDGTAAGTHMVSDIDPGSAGSGPSSLTLFNGEVYFSADDGVHGTQLWKSDGTAAGTQMVTDLSSTLGFAPTRLIATGSKLFFVADDNTDAQLWATDGTAAGTVQLTQGFRQFDLTTVNDGIYQVAGDRLYFAGAPQGPPPFSLYSSDGTGAAPTLVANCDPLTPIIAVGPGILFSGFGPGTHTQGPLGDSGFFLSEGTPGGTVVLNPWAEIIGDVVVGGRAFLEVASGAAPQDLQLWVSDGTVAGTHDVMDFAAASPSAASGLMTAFGGGVLFSAPGPNGLELWESDGTTAGTTPVGGTGSPQNLSPFPVPPDIRDDFGVDGRSDLLIQNGAGAVVTGEVANGAAGFAAVAGLGPEWSFRGAGDFLDDGKFGFLIENAVGAVVVGEVSGGQVAYTQVAALGPEWTFVGAGNLLDGGQRDQFLIENASGAVVVGNVVGGVATYTAVSALGPEWSFKGVGDFLHDGKDQFLIENASGAVAVGEIVSGQASYTAVASLGPEWKFVGSGDFLGDGKSDFLIENAAGAVFAGDVSNGQAQYTQLTGLGPEWKFVGAGDYLGEGHDQFLIENAAGAVVVGDWLNGQIHFTQVAGLGPEWVFH